MTEQSLERGALVDMEAAENVHRVVDDVVAVAVEIGEVNFVPIVAVEDFQETQ